MGDATRAIACIAALLSGCALAMDAHEGKVSRRDYFFYSCVHAYLKANGIRNFDGSLGEAVDASDFDSEELEKQYDAAKAVAKSIRAPDYADSEHGLPAVLMICEKAAARQ